MVFVRVVPFAEGHPHLRARAHLGRGTDGKKFARPQKFSVEKRLRDSFGVQSGQGSFEVVIQFDERVADYIREKKWHESQVLRELEDGGLELRMKLSSLAEVERWVLGWAGHARVLQPPALVESVAQAARQILRNSSAPTAGA